MTIATVGAYGLDMTKLDLSFLLQGTLVSESSTHLTLNTFGEIDTFTGFGFTYDSFGYPTGGTVTGLDESYLGQTVFSASGFSVPATQFVVWAANSMTSTALQTVFAGSDTIVGSDLRDVLFGYGGGDSIAGGGGNDYLDAGAGNNTVYGGAGDDVILASSGQNYLRGDDGNDTLTGASEFDDINGNKGDDVIDGGSGGGDWLVGGQGNDRITSHGSDDILYGNMGNDTLNGGPGSEIIRGGQGDDVLYGAAGNDWLSGDRGNDTITGGTGADIFHTFSGAGLDRVLDFRIADGDRVMLDSGTTYTLKQVGPDAVVDMGNGDQMILVGVQLSALPAGWIFGA
jgi:serralysin